MMKVMIRKPSSTIGYNVQIRKTYLDGTSNFVTGLSLPEAENAVKEIIRAESDKLYTIEIRQEYRKYLIVHDDDVDHAEYSKYDLYHEEQLVGNVEYEFCTLDSLLKE